MFKPGFGRAFLRSSASARIAPLTTIQGQAPGHPRAVEARCGLVGNALHQDQRTEDVNVGFASTIVQQTVTPSQATVRLALEMKL